MHYHQWVCWIGLKVWLAQQKSELVSVGNIMKKCALLTLRNRSIQMADAKRYAIKECQHTNILWLNHKAKLFFTLGFYQRKFKCCSSWTWLLCISLQCPHYYHAHFKGVQSICSVCVAGTVDHLSLWECQRIWLMRSRSPRLWLIIITVCWNNDFPWALLCFKEDTGDLLVFLMVA